MRGVQRRFNTTLVQLKVTASMKANPKTSASFNTTLVQLKGEGPRAFNPRYNRFNTTLVQLKAEPTGIGTSSGGQFQYHSGPIKSGPIISRGADAVSVSIPLWSN